MKLLNLDSTTTLRRGVTERTITAVVEVADEKKFISLEEGHMNFNRAADAVRAFESGTLTQDQVAEELLRAADLLGQVQEKFKRLEGILDGRITLHEKSRRLLVDGDPMDPSLEAHMMRLLRADGSPKNMRDWVAFGRFVENLYANTSAFVRDQLFGWFTYENIHGHGFTLTEDGCFLGYKGLKGTPEAPVSIARGTAVVNGVEYNGTIPNPPGALVEMARSQVQDDPSVGCSTGLHVGTYAYAKSWSRGVLTTVKVNPRDVVSVPTECDAQKIRTCRYTVVDHVDLPLNSLTVYSDDVEDLMSEESSEIAADLPAFESGKRYAVTYRKARGAQPKNYTVEVRNVSSRDIHCALLGEAGFRTFRLESILSAEALETPQLGEVLSQEPPVDDEPEFILEEGRAYAIDYLKNSGEVCDYAVVVTSVIEKPAKTLVTTRLLEGQGYRTFVKDKILHAMPLPQGVIPANPPLDTLEDPGTEEEEFLRRYGYGDSDSLV